jgi:iron complex outermembrane receptor protein
MARGHDGTGGRRDFRLRRCHLGRRLAVSTALALSPAFLAAAAANPIHQGPALASIDVGHGRGDLMALASLSIEELANVEVSSVSKSAQSLSDAPAAVYVITHEDVLRSGATELGDILRLAPNLQVARITAAAYAISPRGFNSAAAEKLLVLVDGRSVYTPFSHGVFWNAQHVPPQDIERIEVISGPGATLWGANAVNGVINIVTRRSGETQGGTLRVGGGSVERHASLQYGGRLGEALTYRVYVDDSDHDDGVTATGADARDGWRRRQGGFRLDWSGGADLVTLQGDAYRGSEHLPASADQKVSGRNLVARWTHPTGGGGTLQVQAYYDHLQRSVSGRFSNRLDTYDLDVQHSFALGGRQQIVWGGGYRVTDDDFPVVPTPPRVQAFNPVGRRQTLSNLFVQDAVALTPALKLTLGLKIEDDPYTGREPLPSARLSWKATDDTLVWAAVSRAVRAPSRLDRDFVEVHGSTVYLTGRDFQPEKLVAYELGYRAQPTARSSVSLSTFYNVYDDLRSFELTHGDLPIVFANEMKGETYGFEAWGGYQVADWWRLSGGYSRLHKDLRFKPGSSRLTGVDIAGDDPPYQASLRSMMDLRHGVAVDVDLRRVGALPAPASPAYTELGARLRWAVSRSLELALTGANLLRPRHPEFGRAGGSLQIGTGSGVETGRSLSLDAQWRF